MQKQRYYQVVLLNGGNKMQSIKTILLFEAMYRHKILGLSLDEIENQLKNYPTQDAENLLKKLRGELSQDTLSRPPETAEDVSVTEAQETGGKAAYQAHFNQMLKDYGATNISDLPADKRKEFFNKIDKHWKSDKESKKNVKEETEVADEMAEFFVEFAEFADIFVSMKKEMEREILDEAGKRTTMTKITRQTKIERAKGNLAMQYAKATNDPMYKKFKKFKDKWMNYKEKIQAKYGPRVRTAARQGGGIQDVLRKAGHGKDKKAKKK